MLYSISARKWLSKWYISVPVENSYYFFCVSKRLAVKHNGLTWKVTCPNVLRYICKVCREMVFGLTCRIALKGLPYVLPFRADDLDSRRPDDGLWKRTTNFGEHLPILTLK